MSEYINERGFLTEEGKKIFQSRFGREVDALLSIGTSDNEVKLIGSILKAIIGEKVCDKTISKK